MILAYLPHSAVSNVIDSAIADMRSVQDTVADDGGSQSSGHPAQLGHGQRAVMNFDIGLLDGAINPLRPDPIPVDFRGKHLA